MQELIDNLNAMRIDGKLQLSPIAEEILANEFNNLLEKEKEQIIDAYYGNIEGVYGYREAGEQYYNETYKNE